MGVPSARVGATLTQNLTSRQYQRRISPEKKSDAPTAATSTAPQKRAPPLPAPATSRAVKPPITNSGRPTSQRQLTAERPGGVLKVRLRPQRSRAIQRS